MVSQSDVLFTSYLFLVRHDGCVVVFTVIFLFQVLDECLRAISGFKGTEDLFDDKLLDTPFTSDLIKTKKVSSAPLYEHESPQDLKKETEAFVLGREQWLETTEKHMPFILWHTSAMVGYTTLPKNNRLPF